jgi:hypothetical protein
MKCLSPVWFGRFIVLGLFLLACAAVRADQGMWLFTSPPAKILQDKYGFEPDAKWLEHLQKSSVRFPGGSGSFVSADGLVMTNHHVGRGTLGKLSTKERNIAHDGYLAKSRVDELKCPDLELIVLMSIEDVTDRVNAAVESNSSAGDAEKARRAVIATIEKESTDKTGLKSDVVTLYQGGQYHLYRYKRYNDVRLVFAPDADIAHFGGDPDNFEFPRYCLDMCFFRVYEGGKPVKVEHHLRWSDAGARDDELVFVSGHPGRTSRLNTVAHLEYFRDTAYPVTLGLLRRQEVLMKTFSERGAENARRARGEYLGVQNGRKLYVGMMDGLQNPAVMEQKRAEEKALRDAVLKDPGLKKLYGDAWDQVAASIEAARPLHQSHLLLEGRGRGLAGGLGFNTHLFGIARTLVRYAEEKEKPNAERLREYRETALPTLKQQLFSPAPIYEDFETQKLADSLGLFVEMRGGEDELVKKVLAGKAPSARAAELVRGTKLREVSARKALFEGGKAAVDASDDAMIRLARLVDGPARAVRKEYEQKVEEPQKQAYAKISRAIFALKGKDQYPDATFTLRLAFGTVKGYAEIGRPVAPFTTFGGAFRHAEEHNNLEPFNLPRRWLDRKAKLDLATPFDFVCTADIIGGNSGSPVVNRKGEVVGLIFDGNIQSLTADFLYTEEQGRAVAVDSRGIVEALRHVYQAEGLAEEITGKK